MLKKMLLILSLFTITAAYAGPVEDAMASSDKVFLYLYTPRCSACKAFNPLYEMYARKYGSDCKFVRVNASTPYGTKTGMSVGLKYVPWVTLIDTTKSTGKHLEWECLRVQACAQKRIEQFINN